MTASTVSDAQIQTEITRQINIGILPAPVKDAQGNAVTYYAVFFPHGKTITQGGSNSCQAGGFCAYTANAVLATLATYSNLNKATGYVQKSFDLSAYRGQTIRVYFRGVEDVSLQTSFVLDDIAVTVAQ